jgi:predicted ATPase
MAATSTECGRRTLDALAHLNDLTHLQTHPLIGALHSHASEKPSGAVLRGALLEAIESLRPDARLSVGSPLRRRHQLLELRYVQGLDPVAVQARLGIGKSHYYRQHRDAVAAVISSLHERWTGRVADEAPPRKRIGPGPRVPRPLTHLIGRETDLERTRQLLTKHRLVTLVGPPGGGKTSLALELAHAMASQFADGTVFVPLATAIDPDLVLSAVAVALEVGEVGADPMRSLVAHLGSKRMLLLLDNFEQIVEAGPGVAHLLQECPDSAALVTSRVPLDVRGEQTYQVRPLAGPVAERVEEIMASPAVQLFIERARARAPDLQLSDADLARVAAICRRGDGLPLAIELAAAWSDVLPMQDILARLDHPLAFLQSGPRDLPAHQRTLNEAIAWSYALLSPPERRDFARLAVFLGGWDIEAASEVITNGQDGLANVLARLVRSNLVRMAPTETDAEQRYDMLETIHEFARERLAEDPRESLIRAKHARHYRQLAETSDLRLIFAGRMTSLARLKREEANLAAALAWAMEHRERDMALQLAAALGELDFFTGQFGRGRRQLESALELPDGTGTGAPTVRAWYRLGELALRSGDFVAARAAQEHALETAQELADVAAVGYCLLALKRTVWRLGLHDKAHALEDRALRLFRAIGDPVGQAEALNGWGQQALIDGDLDAARTYLDEALSLAEMPITHYFLGRVALERRQFEEARERFAASLALNRALGIKEGTAQALEGFAMVGAAAGRANRAIRLAAAADAIRQSAGIPLGPWWGAELETKLQPAVDSLTPEERAAAWADGGQLGLEEAIRYALGDER